MGFALGELQDVKEYVTRPEISATRSCSLLEGLRINSQSSDHLELESKELWRASWLHIVLGHGACMGTLGLMECQKYVLYVVRKH